MNYHLSNINFTNFLNLKKHMQVINKTNDVQIISIVFISKPTKPKQKTTGVIKLITTNSL